MNEVTARGALRTDCAVAMVYRTLANLKREGLIEGGSIEITPQGESLCLELDAAGFEFNPGEMESVLAFILGGGEALYVAEFRGRAKDE